MSAELTEPDRATDHRRRSPPDRSAPSAACRNSPRTPLSIRCRSRSRRCRLRDVRCRSLHAAEWQVHFGADGRRIDVGDAGVQVAHGRRRPCSRPWCRARTTVRTRCRWRCRSRLPDRRRRMIETTGPKISSCAMRIFGSTSVEHRRLHEVAVLVVAVVESIAAADQLRALVLADLDVLQVGLELAFVHGRTHLDCLVQAVADPQPLARIQHSVDELAVARPSAR